RTPIAILMIIVAIILLVLQNNVLMSVEGDLNETNPYFDSMQLMMNFIKGITGFIAFALIALGGFQTVKDIIDYHGSKKGPGKHKKHTKQASPPKA
ncbi:hypothetical protein JW868_00130, partial [Candidatus Woesearchaeota archaeon]|nr:hypothetical protein [Candidatus Woesearchaeota archaeon]